MNKPKPPYINEFNLPIPRLQIKNIKTSSDTYESIYSLIKIKTLSEVEEVEMGRTKVSIPGGKVSPRDLMSLPRRDGAHIFYDMYHLKLRGFIVCDSQFEELNINDPDRAPLKLLAILKSN